jgi:hypothetical protein
MIVIPVEPPDEAGRGLWSTVGDLVELLPADWVLIGGLMVQLHAFELGVEDMRATTDIDVLGQARPPGALTAIDAALAGDGFVAHWPDFDGYAHRYVRDGLVVDVLAPDASSARRHSATARRSACPAVLRRSPVRRK